MSDSETLWTVAGQTPCPWASPGKNTRVGVGCHFLLQSMFLTQGLNHHLLQLRHCRWFFATESPGKPDQRESRSQTTLSSQTNHVSVLLFITWHALPACISHRSALGSIVICQQSLLLLCTWNTPPGTVRHDLTQHTMGQWGRAISDSLSSYERETHPPSCPSASMPWALRGCSPQLNGRSSTHLHTSHSCAWLLSSLFFFNWSKVDLQCCVNSWCTAKQFNYILDRTKSLLGFFCKM